MTNKRAILVDIKRCIGCQQCEQTCQQVHGFPVEHKAQLSETALTFVDQKGEKFVRRMCLHCEEPACASACLVGALKKSALGPVTYDAKKCMGCRYCMTACPYHARYFNWGDPEWPAGMEHSLNPGVATRMRGVVEKCNLCHARLHAAEDKAAAEKRADIDPADYVPACVECCPTNAITFGDLADQSSAVAQAARSPQAFRLLEKLGTEPKVSYRSNRPWVRALAESRPGASQEVQRG